VAQPLLTIASPDPATLVLRGELDLSNADELDEALKPLVDRGGTVTVDLSDLTFADSSGIGVLMRAARNADGKVALVLLNPRPNVAKVFRIMGLDQIPSLEVRSG
jgi:anti-anti-sigma factor